MALSRSVLTLAARIDRWLARDYAEYLEACESWRKDGYRPHYCEHGTNQWTDYDNICGGCEDGRTMGDPMQRMEFALDSAKRRVEKVQQITSALTTVRNLVPGFVVPDEAWKEVTRLLTVE